MMHLPITGIVSASGVPFNLWGDLVEAWEFIADSLVGDVGGVNLTASGTAFGNVTGMRDQAKNGTGNRRQHLANLPFLHTPSNPYTIYAWVRSYTATSYSPPTSSAIFGLVDNSKYPTVTYPYLEFIVDGGPAMRWTGGSSTGPQTDIAIQNAWRLMAIRWDGVSVMNFYVDGRQTQFTQSPFYNSSGVRFYMGNPNIGATGGSVGYRSYVYIDSIRVFNRWLTDLELFAHYNAGTGLDLLESLSEPNIVLTDNFTGANGTLLTDAGWTSEEGGGTATIQSNKASMTGATTQAYSKNAGVSDMRSSAEFNCGLNGASMGVTARVVDGNNLWLAWLTFNASANLAGFRLYERNAGTWTQRGATVNLTAIAGKMYRITLECVGSNIVASMNNGVVISHSSTLHDTATKGGFRISHSSSSTSTVDLFRVEAM